MFGAASRSLFTPDSGAGGDMHNWFRPGSSEGDDSSLFDDTASSIDLDCSQGGQPQPQEASGGLFASSWFGDVLVNFLQRLNVVVADRSDLSSSTTSSGKSCELEATPVDFACPICLQLLFQPVSTSCGHTFCHDCIHIAHKQKPECPVCRAHLPSVPSLQGVHTLLRCLIMRNYPEQYEARARGHGGIKLSRHTLSLDQASTVSSKDDLDNISLWDDSDNSNSDNDDDDGDDADNDANSTVSSLDSEFPPLFVPDRT